jgi:hypothetical protein
MEAFGIIGMSLGSSAFVFALVAMNKVSALEKQLRDKGLLETEEAVEADA